MGTPKPSRSALSLAWTLAAAMMILGPAGTAAQCSDSDVSAAAVENCVNAVRGDPAYWSQFAPCDFSGYAPAPALCSDGALSSAAQVHSDNMAARGYIGHDGFQSRVRGAGYGGSRIAENVAGGQSSALDVVMSWMCSSGHAANIMDCGFQSVGTGTQCGYGGCYFTQEFGGSGGCGGGCGGSYGYGSADYGGVDDGGDGGRSGSIIGRGPISRFLNFLFG